jgi:diguanylate cyclase (GGDEF)-like protein/PAS domain S-box-containing protein
MNTEDTRLQAWSAPYGDRPHAMATAPPRTGYTAPISLGYAVACLTSSTMSVVARFRGDAPNDPNICGLMLLPVILSAFFGGAGPGLTATAIGAATILLLPATHGKPSGALDALFVLVLFSSNGLLVSLLGELQRRSRGAAESAQAFAKTQFESRRHTEASLRVVQAAFQQSHEGIAIIRPGGTILAVNPATSLISGYSPDELLGANMRLLKSGRHNAEFYRAMFKSVHGAGFWQGEIWNRRKSGEVYPQWVTLSTTKSDVGLITHYIATFTDMSVIKRSQDELHHLAHHDALTDLPNRLMLTSRLSHAAARIKRNGGWGAALMVDLDHFRTVNDSLGHAAGDELLQSAVTRMLGRIRQCDLLARIGGDEFMVVLENLDTPLHAGAAAQGLIDELSHPFILSTGQDVCVGASVGVCIFPDDATEPAQILRNADAALHQAKAAGRNTYRFYTLALTTLANERLVLESRLRKAHAHKEFVLHYQPLADMANRRIGGVEALIRWMDPVEGMISPARFIPLAEETGLIVEIGTWVLRSACSQMKLWLDAGSPIEMVAVNLSPRQFRHPDLVGLVRDTLAETGLPAHRLELEITEGALIDDADDAVDKLNQLKALGVRLAIDDFGTGYSSLAYLKRFPVNKLKVDQAFVRGVPANRTDCEIVAAVIALGKALGLEVLAEGIESEEQFGHLMALGCDTAQGYLLGRPVPAAELS